MLKPKPYNSGTWTRSRYFTQIRSHLRNAFRYYLPIMNTKKAARRPNQSANKRLKWESQCGHCKQWFPEKETQVDHNIPCGSLKEMWDVPIFIEKLSAEDGCYTNLCKPCHKKVTAEERNAPKTAFYYTERIEYYKNVINALEGELKAFKATKGE